MRSKQSRLVKRKRMIEINKPVEQEESALLDKMENEFGRFSPGRERAFLFPPMSTNRHLCRTLTRLKCCQLQFEWESEADLPDETDSADLWIHICTAWEQKSNEFSFEIRDYKINESKNARRFAPRGQARPAESYLWCQDKIYETTVKTSSLVKCGSSSSSVI